MSFRTQAHLGRISEVVGLLGTLYGLQRIFENGSSGQGALLAIGILLISVVVGMAGFIAARYNATRDENDNRSDRLAVETLAKLGKQAQRQPLQPKKRK